MIENKNRFMTEQQKSFSFEPNQTRQEQSDRNKKEKQKQKLIERYVEEHLLRPFNSGNKYKRSLSESGGEERKENAIKNLSRAEKHLKRAERRYAELSPAEKANKLYAMLLTRVNKQTARAKEIETKVYEQVSTDLQERITQLKHKRELKEGDKTTVAELMELKGQIQGELTTPTINYSYLSKVKALWDDEEVRKLFLEKYFQARVDTQTFKESVIGKKWQDINQQIEEAEKEYQDLTRKIFLGKIGDKEELNNAREEIAFLAKDLVELRQSQNRIVTLEKLPQSKDYTDLAAMIQFEKMKKYRNELSDGFVWTDSRLEIDKKATESVLDNDMWPCFIGEPGTGKTRQGVAMVRKLTGKSETVGIDCSDKTNKTDLLFSQEIRDGYSTRDLAGFGRGFTGYDSLDQEKPSRDYAIPVELAEIFKANGNSLFFTKLKAIASKHPGEKLDELVPLPVLEGSFAYATTNPPGMRHQNDPPNPALWREFAPIPVDYFPMTIEKPEVFEFMQVALMTERYDMPGVSKDEVLPYYELREIPDKKKRYAQWLKFKKKFDEDYKEAQEANNQEEIKRLKQEVYRAYDELGVLPNGETIVRTKNLVQDPTDKRHGILYRLSFAVRAIQDSYIVALGENEYLDSNNRQLLRIDKEQEGGKVVDNGGVEILINNKTITAETLIKWMEGYRNRKMKDDKEMAGIKNLSQWIQHKLNQFLEDAGPGDRVKIKAIFDYFHLFDEVSDVQNEELLTPLEIGYLSPRVPRWEKTEKISLEDLEADGENTETEEGEIEVQPEDLKTEQVVLENGDLVNVKKYQFEFKQGDKLIKIQQNDRFELNGKIYIFMGKVERKNNEYHRQLVAKIQGSKECQIMSREEIERGRKELMGRASLERAQEILGKENVIGPEDVKKTWGYIPENIPSIQFSKEALERASELGLFLELRIKKDKEGNHLTIKRMNELKRAFSGRRLLHSISLDERQRYFTEKSTLELEWVLISKDIIGRGPEGAEYQAVNKTYLEQTEVIEKYLREKLFKDNPLPKELAEAIQEYEVYLKNHPEFFTNPSKRIFKSTHDLAIVLSNDGGLFSRTKYCEELAGLKINQMTRSIPTDIIYDIICYYEKNNKQLFKNISISTRYLVPSLTTINKKNFVYIYNTGMDGIQIDSHFASDYDLIPGKDNIGVSLSLTSSVFNL